MWSEEDDDSYTLPDPEIPLVYTCTMGSNVPLSETMVLCLPKLLIGRKRKNMERATSMLGRISFRNLRVLTLTPA